MIRVKSDVIKERLDWLKFELSINDELETVIGGKTCYLGPAFNIIRAMKIRKDGYFIHMI